MISVGLFQLGVCHGAERLLTKYKFNEDLLIEILILFFVDKTLRLCMCVKCELIRSDECVPTQNDYPNSKATTFDAY